MLKGLGTALVGSIMVLALLGIALGTSLSDTELLNPATSAAQARSVDARTQLDTAQAQLEIEQQQAEITAQQAADTLDLKHQAAMYEQIEERSEAEIEHHKEMLAMEKASLQSQHELQLRHQQQAFERQVAMREIQQLILLGVGSGAILAVAVAVVYYLYACGQAKLAQVPRVQGRRQIAGSNGKYHAQQPAGVTPRQPVTPVSSQRMVSSEGSQGGNGRGPGVALRRHR
jgi:flagellar motor protein MotB